MNMRQGRRGLATENAVWAMDGSHAGRKCYRLMKNLRISRGPFTRLSLELNLASCDLVHGGDFARLLWFNVLFCLGGSVAWGMWCDCWKRERRARHGRGRWESDLLLSQVARLQWLRVWVRARRKAVWMLLGSGGRVK
jgi:hypothetical protein